MIPDSRLLLPMPLLVLALAPCAAAQAKVADDARAVIDRIDRARGAKKLPASLVIEGQYRVLFEGAANDQPVAEGGFRDAFVGDAARHESDMGPLGKLERGLTKDLVWELDPHLGAKRYDGPAGATVRRYFALLRGDSPSTLYTEISRTGSESIDGKEHVVLTMKPASGRPDVWYVDASTGHVGRVDIALPSPDSAGAVFDMDDVIESQLLLGEWRAIDGVFHPHRRELRMGPAIVISTCTEVSAGVEVDPATMAPPEAVTKLPSKLPGRPIGDPAGATYTIVERQPQPVASIRVKCKPTEISATLAVLLPEVMQHLTAIGAKMAGPPFSRYHAFGDDSVDIEAGIPVAKAIEGKGRIAAGELPGGRIVTAWHIGPYHDLGKAHEALSAWVATKELETRGGPWEVYWTDPGMVPDSSKWRTQLFQPVGK